MTSTELPEVHAFIERAAVQSAIPLWEHMDRLVPERPIAPVSPTQWRYDELRPMLMEACDVVSAADAERRVLMLVNPQLLAAGAAAPTLYAGLQVLLPGETAPNHRHTATAIRFVIEGHGAVTSIGDLDVLMEPGDLVLTPSWAWHDHTHGGERPVVWLDALDIPMVNLLAAGFAERADRSAVGGAWKDEPTDSTRYHFAWKDVEAVLRQRAATGDVSAVDGVVYRYTNEADKPLTPTMSCTARWMPGGFRGCAARRTGNTVFHVVRGHGTTSIGDTDFHWSPGDVFVVPSWCTFRHTNGHANDEAVLFAFSDDVVLQTLGMYREEF